MSPAGASPLPPASALRGAGAGATAGRRTATSASRGSTSAASLRAKAERSASNWRGLSLLRVGLKTKLWTPICRARRRSDWFRLSVIISTGGRRFIFHSRFTTSKPPWNDAPPDAGMPRSVTSTKGSRLSRSRPAAFVAVSGSDASSTPNPAAVKWPARMRRTSSSSSTRRRVREGAGSTGSPSSPAAGCFGPGAGGSAAGGPPGESDARAAGPGASASAGGASAGASPGTDAAAARPGRGGAARPPGDVASGSSSDARSRANAEAGTIGTSETTASSGAAKEASTAAADWARSSSMPSAMSRSISCGLMPTSSVSWRRSRPPTRTGTSSLSSNPKAPSRRRASCSRANPIRARTARSRASRGSVPRRGSAGGEPAVNAETTRPSRNTIAPSPPSISIARWPVFRLKETIWMMSRSGRSSRLPCRPKVSGLLGGSYTAARISPATRSRGTTRSTTPASMAALGMP